MRIRFLKNEPPVQWIYKTLAYRPVKQHQQRIVVPFDVQNCAWFAMQAKLSPRNDFAKFLKCAISARHRYKTVGDSRHLCFAVVHRPDNDQLRHSTMRELPPDQSLWNDANHFSAFL